jgi:WD40 repeat protein
MGNIYLLSTVDGSLIRKFDRVDTAYESLVFSPNGSSFRYKMGDVISYFSDINTSFPVTYAGTGIPAGDTQYDVSSMAFSPDGSLFAIGYQSGLSGSVKSAPKSRMRPWKGTKTTFLG